LNDIEHRKTKARKPQTNGFMERFNGIVLDEFLRTAFSTKFYEILEELQVNLDKWLVITI
jgi:transposase InsO family protein